MSEMTGGTPEIPGTQRPLWVQERLRKRKTVVYPGCNKKSHSAALLEKDCGMVPVVSQGGTLRLA